MLCRTCETVIPDSEVKCPKCGNNPKIWNRDFVNKKDIEKDRIKLYVYGGILELIRAFYIYLIASGAETNDMWLLIFITTVILWFGYIGILRYSFIKPVDMRWIQLGAVFPIAPPLMYRKISEKAESNMFAVIAVIVIIGVICMFVFHK